MDDRRGDLQIERLLSGLLHYGTWLASTIAAVGIVIAILEQHASTHIPDIVSHLRLVTVGIACFIALPVARVVLTLVVFLRHRDYWFVAITAFVLTTIALGFVIGTYWHAQIEG